MLSLLFLLFKLVLIIYVPSNDIIYDNHRDLIQTLLPTLSQD